MRRCLLCSYEVELDDQVVSHGGRTICLRCFLHETEPATAAPAVRVRLSGAVRAAIRAALDREGA